MTHEEKVRAVREFWRRNRGRFKATEGARLLATELGLPVNTMRGLQNRLFSDPDTRPWNAEPADPSHETREIPHEGLTLRVTLPKTCPACEKTAHTTAGLLHSFGTRKVKRAGGKHVLVSQSYCKVCKATHNRTKYAERKKNGSST